jgi:hypothetical protein
MHKCLSCNRPCSISSIFCDACRDALLERGAEVAEEEQELVRAGSREGGTGELLPSAPLVAAQASSLEEQGQEFFSAETEAEQSWPQASEENSRSFETSGIHTVEMAEEVVDEMSETDQRSGKIQATNVLAVPLPARRTIPRRVRRALLLFCIVGTLALLTDGVLLALSIIRHHSAPAALHYDEEGFMRRLTPTASAVPVTPTPGVHPMSQAGMLLLSSARLVFTATEGQAELAPQTVTLSGGQQSTFSWLIVPAKALPAWLHLSATEGNATAGVTPAVMVSVEPAQLSPGSYTATLLVKAFDSHGKVLAGSPATLVVALSVRAPCTLNVAPAKLSFASVLVSGPSPQTLTLSEGSSCTFPVSWQISSDASWIIFSHSSGTDTGAGSSLVVQASSAGKLIGSYTAHITLTATDGSGAPVVISPTVIIATLTVIG